MSDRLAPVIRSEVGDPVKPVYDRFSSMADGMFGSPEDAPFILKRPRDGALVGPFPFFFEQPEAGEYWLGLFSKLALIPNFPKDSKEVVILAVGARFKAAYELYAHTAWAIKLAGLPKEQAESIASGKKPEGLSEANSVAYDTATYLAGTPGPLPQELWDGCIRHFGKEGTVALIHYAGAYAYTCIALNAMDAPVPKESD